MEADWLAKQTAKVNSDSHHSCYAMMGANSKPIKILLWRDQYDRYRKDRIFRNTSYISTYVWNAKGKPVVLREANRKTASAYYQLKLMHGYFKAYVDHPSYSRINFVHNVIPRPC